MLRPIRTTCRRSCWKRSPISTVLLSSSGMPAGFDGRSPLKVYVRHAADEPQVRAFLQQQLPGVPVLLLHGDI
ncbi:hypothetical protein RLIN73S_00029 [Rhodanobacter lindaniclasticus]